MRQDIRFLGCDPGLDGALVLIDLLGNALKWRIMPTVTFEVSRTRKVKGEVTKAGNPKTTTKPGKQRDTDVLLLATVFREMCGGANEMDVVYAAIEDVGIFQAPMSRNVVGYFQKNKGALVALAHTYCRKIFLIPPKTWTADVFKGKGKASKGRNILLAKELSPELAEAIDKYGDGLADARLIAESLRLKYVWYLEKEKCQP